MGNSGFNNKLFQLKINFDIIKRENEARPLVQELMAIVFSFLPPVTLIGVSRTCKHFYLSIFNSHPLLSLYKARFLHSFASEANTIKLHSDDKKTKGVEVPAPTLIDNGVLHEITVLRSQLAKLKFKPVLNPGKSSECFVYIKIVGMVVKTCTMCIPELVDAKPNDIINIDDMAKFNCRKLMQWIVTTTTAKLKTGPALLHLLNKVYEEADRSSAASNTNTGALAS